MSASDSETTPSGTIRARWIALSFISPLMTATLMNIPNIINFYSAYNEHILIATGALLIFISLFATSTFTLDYCDTPNKTASDANFTLASAILSGATTILGTLLVGHRYLYLPDTIAIGILAAAVIVAIQSLILAVEKATSTDEPRLPPKYQNRDTLAAIASGYTASGAVAFLLRHQVA